MVGTEAGRKLWGENREQGTVMTQAILSPPGGLQEAYTPFLVCAAECASRVPPWFMCVHACAVVERPRSLGPATHGTVGVCGYGFG